MRYAFNQRALAAISLYANQSEAAQSCSMLKQLIGKYSNITAACNIACWDKITSRYKL